MVILTPTAVQWTFASPVTVGGLLPPNGQGLQVNPGSGFINPTASVQGSPTTIICDYGTPVNDGEPWRTEAPFAGLNPLPLDGQSGLIIL